MSEPFSASRVARLIQCPGSAHLELSIPGWVPPVVDDSKGAKGRGKLLHAIMQTAAQLTPKDIEHLVTALEYINKLRKNHRFTELTEQTVECTWLLSRPHTTADLVLYNSDELHVVDYKFGAIPVEVVGNEQLMFYAISYGHLAPKARGVWMHIVQPAAGGCDNYFVTAKELKEFMLRAQAAEQKILNQDTTLHPSDHCLFCPAYPHSRGDRGKPLCPPAMKLLYPMNEDTDAVLAL